MAEFNHDTVTPYDQVEIDKKTQVTTMFDRIAPYYDFLNRLLTLGIDQRWRKKAIKSLDTREYDKILDIATGTADLAVALKERLKVNKVIGLDISPNMIELASKKVEKMNLKDSVEVEVGDSEKLRFEDESFDGATASFGIRNFQNLNKGLSEICRVLRPGGKIMILEFSKPTIFPFKQLFNLYFKYVLPVIGRITSKDPKAYQYLYESVQAFPDYDRMVEILEDIGFKNIKYTPLTLGICTIYLGEK